jgi:hypothetical protein
VISLSRNIFNNCEPFNGAGGSGEIRDRLAGGQGSCPGRNSSYMTSLLKIRRKQTLGKQVERWLYQTPMDI